MGYAAVEAASGRWEVMVPEGGRLRVGSSLDDDARIVSLGSEEACGHVLAALADGTLEPSGMTPGGDPVLDVDEYRAWYENL